MSYINHDMLMNERMNESTAGMGRGGGSNRIYRLELFIHWTNINAFGENVWYQMCHVAS